MMICDCDERIGIDVDSYKLFESLKMFFENQVDQGIFNEIEVEKPFYIGYSKQGGEMVC